MNELTATFSRSLFAAMDIQAVPVRITSRLVASCLVLSVLASSVQAQASRRLGEIGDGLDDAAREIDTAQALVAEGIAAAKQGSCDDAILILEHAEEIQHDAAALFYLGHCYLRQGELARGYRAMQAVLSEAPPTGARGSRKRIYSMARTLSAATENQISFLRITVVPEDPPELRVTLDGEDLPVARLNVMTAVEEGKHTIEVNAIGFKPARLLVVSKPSERRVVAASLESIRENTGAAPASSALAAREELSPLPAPRSTAALSSNDPAQDRSAASAGRSTSHWLAYTAWGMGIVGIGVGTAFGVAAFEAKSDLEAECPNDSCPKSASSSLEAAQNKALIANIAFGAGLGLGLLGTIIHLTAGSQSDADESAHAGLSVGLGPLGARVTGQF